MEKDIAKIKVIAAVAWQEDDGRRHGAYYGYWSPDDENMIKLKDFVREKHGNAPDVELTVYLVEDVTGRDPERVSIAANTIGYALQDAGMELTEELALKAAERLADQGLLK